MAPIEIEASPHIRSARLRQAATAAMSVLVVALIAGCATTQPKESEPEAEPVKEEVKEPETTKPLEFKKVYFEYDQADLRESGKASLKLAVDQLLEQADAKINVEGHCDERGSDKYNIDLGWKRAYAVRDYLKRLGVNEDRMFPISYGRARPTVIGHDESVWSKNRRVEIAERK